MLRQFGIEPTLNELTNLSANIKFGVFKFEKYGRMTDDDLKKIGIIKNNYDSTPKDQHTLIQERCVILSHTSTVDRFNKRKKEKDNANILTMNKKIERENKKKRKLEETAAKSEYKKNKKNINNADTLTNTDLLLNSEQEGIIMCYYSYFD